MKNADEPVALTDELIESLADRFDVKWSTGMWDFARALFEAGTRAAPGAAPKALTDVLDLLEKYIREHAVAETNAHHRGFVRRARAEVDRLANLHTDRVDKTADLHKPAAPGTECG